MKKMLMTVLAISGCAPTQSVSYTPYTPNYIPQSSYSEFAPSHQQCLEDERIAFAYQVLQTQLMVAALKCAQHDAYNAFVTRHQTALQQANGIIASYYGRRDGSDGQERRDAYITELANAQAQGHDADFCQTIAPVVEQALTLSNADEISHFVTDSRLTNPEAGCSLERTAEIH
jgi:hypothetical protein